MHKICTHYTGTQDKKIWPTIRASTTQAHIILKYALGTYMNLILRENYHGPFGPVL